MAKVTLTQMLCNRDRGLRVLLKKEFQCSLLQNLKGRSCSSFLPVQKLLEIMAGISEQANTTTTLSKQILPQHATNSTRRQTGLATSCSVTAQKADKFGNKIQIKNRYNQSRLTTSQRKY
jgi:hypothetical protein